MKVLLYFKRLVKFVLFGQQVKKVTARVCYLSPAQRLLGKNIVITGGSRGIGLAMARKFSSEGANVLITGRNEEILKNVSNELQCKYLVLDIQDVNAFENFLIAAENELGGIDCLVNNAGISLHEKTFFDVTQESFDKQVNTNFRGPFFLTQYYVKRLIAKYQAGNVLFISSETGITKDIRPYGYTKAAINSMVQGLAFIFAKNKIRINAIAPGITATEMTGFSIDKNLYCKKNMTERVYLPDEIAESACFLLSDASECVSGQILVCNNGRTVNSRIKR